MKRKEDKEEPPEDVMEDGIEEAEKEEEEEERNISEEDIHSSIPERGGSGDGNYKNDTLNFS